MKVLIIGGGVAGLTIAWRLALEGFVVEIVERGVCGRGASWAAAGMIAPGVELAGEETPLGEFTKRARAMWPDFSAELEQVSGIPISYRETGSLFVATTSATAEQLRSHMTANAEWLARESVLECEPLLSPDIAGALGFGFDAQVDNRALCNALYSALNRNGVVLHENCEVASFVCVNAAIAGVVTTRGMMSADAVVLASGAWVNLLSEVGIELPPVKPVKGQMAAFSPAPGMTLPNRMVWSDEVYLVSQRGCLLAGATVEDAGFDTSVERTTSDVLVQRASSLIPSLAQWPLVEFWCGLRPRTPDDAPVIGATAISNLFVAGGQFRNGILFAPAIAELAVAIISGRDTGLFGAAFSPVRFGA